jgi:hypothetical protein
MFEITILALAIIGVILGFIKKENLAYGCAALIGLLSLTRSIVEHDLAWTASALILLTFLTLSFWQNKKSKFKK